MIKVLLVEDDPLIYRLYQKLFTLEHFEIELAKNGREGIDKLKTFKADIILLDVMMPDMNGVEMLTEIKADSDTKDIPVVVLTNMSEPTIAHAVISKGAVLCLIKSQLEPEEVISAVKGVLDKYGQPNEDQSTETPQN